MAREYALVHLEFTIPLALLLTVVAYPILNRVHVFQIAILIVIAFVATLPWDAYLIRHNVWTYPPEAIIGPRFWGIPIEELFFFVIQTYITSMLYTLINKPILQAQYLLSQKNPPLWIRRVKLSGQILLLSLVVYGAHLIQVGGRGTYLGLILVWAPPFALITWSVAGVFIISIPPVATVVPILLPTIYLWFVDEYALGRGTWAIESRTKLELKLFGSLEIEEAAFFLATNVLIVFGQAAFDQYLGVIYAFPDLFPSIPEVPSPHLLVQSRLVDVSKYDMVRIQGIREAVARLQKKSRSFYLASAAFTGRLRIDLVLLYSFCRMADDLVDHAKSQAEVTLWTTKLIDFLNLHYGTDHSNGKEPNGKTSSKAASKDEIEAFINDNFPLPTRSALRLLPASILPPTPLYNLISGFKTDARFSFSSSPNRFPITDEDALRDYSQCVAGTVGELCVALIAHHCGPNMDPALLHLLQTAANQMGIALQYVNIARDIQIDAAMGRVYIPTTWLREEGTLGTPMAVLERPRGEAIERMRMRLLRKAFALYAEARPVMKRLPKGARGPMIVAVENYMEIGRVLREGKGGVVGEGKATVPAGRRIVTALRALIDGL